MGLISNGSTIFDNGSMGSGFGGSLVFIKKLTASSSATLSFVDGSSGVVLDDTYKEYLFTFKNIHPGNNSPEFQFQTSTNGGSSYGVTLTSTHFRTVHREDDSYNELGYNSSYDLAQSTSFQQLCRDISNNNDISLNGTLNLFNPSSTTFVKHFIATTLSVDTDPASENEYVAGYFNTTSAINGIRFQFNSGNIDSGDICLYGIA
jgi:hypothetical protein